MKALVIGGTGSIGKAIVKKLLCMNGVEKIGIFSRDEKKQDDMKKEFANYLISYYIGDIKDFDSINYAMHGYDTVFHVAALKQITSCEENPLEAYKTNVVGTDNVIEACNYNKVYQAVIISTDKAVNPSTAMGLSKAMMEKIVLKKSDRLTKLIMTRFGNIICSRGSVVPLWINQIKNGQSVTITDSNMARFLMTSNQAADLIIKALSGRSGDIFIYDSGKCYLDKLIEAIELLFGKAKDKIFTGARKNEKFHETLITSEEFKRTIYNGDHHIIRKDLKEEEAVKEESDLTTFNARNMNISEIIELLKQDEYIQKELKS